MTLTKNDYKYFFKARKAALLSDNYKFHVGCIAVYQGSIISIGCNCNKTHPMQKHYNKYRARRSESNPTLHAEINCISAIRRLNINFSKVKLYIYRTRKDRPFGLSRPCQSCMEAIKDLGIRDIYYTTNDGYAHEIVEFRGVA